MTLHELVYRVMDLAWAAGHDAARLGYLKVQMNATRDVDRILAEEQLLEKLREPVRQILNHIDQELERLQETRERSQPPPDT